MKPKDLPNDIQLVAVTKGRSAQAVMELIEAGLTDIGENRLQEFEQKMSEIPFGLKKQVRKHYIGQLQRKKVKKVVGQFDMIQSVDSLELAQAIDGAAQALHKKMPILMQVNTSGIEHQGGVPLGEAAVLAMQIRQLEHVDLQGLMTIALQSEDEDEVRKCFRHLKELGDKIGGMEILSMGMSEDYELAIAEGSTMVRLGRALFD